MQRIIDTSKNFMANFNEHSQPAHRRFEMKVYPQMPFNQITHYIKQAAKKGKRVIIQLNPTPFTHEAREVAGAVSLSERSNHVILTSGTDKMIHLISPHFIRHLRLADD